MYTNMNNATYSHEAQTQNGSSRMNSDMSKVMKSITRLILFLVCFVWYSPYVYATVERIKKQPALNQIQNHYELGAELELLRKNLRSYLRKLGTYEKQIRVGSQSYSESKLKFPSLNLDNLENIRELDEQQRETLEVNLSHLESRQLAQKNIAQQREALYAYEQHMAGLYAALSDIEKHQATLDTKVLKGKLQTTLKLIDQPLSRPHESFSNDLDFIQGPPRNLYTSQSQVNGLVGTDGGLYTQTDSATEATTAINDKITELGTDPLSLYNWVHDNIRWIPSYGVMQGADYTLQTLQGNAFDTSSLLISLLRAAGHEARYQYGVINIPIDQAINWVGNVKNADAATNLISQGGIPQVQVNYGGAAEIIRMEHVWVEIKQGDDWYNLDPSFKQYTYTEGLDLESAISFDAPGLLEQLENTSTSNEAEGWVQGVDASLIEAELSAYQTELESYLSTNMPEATLGDVLGLQSINLSAALTLEDAAPSYEIQLSAAVDHLPESLFYHFQYQVGSTVSFDLGASFSWGGEYFSLNLPTTELVGKDIAMSFRPATAADEAVIESYLPETITSAEDLPSSLPAGSINMIGELTIDGVVEHATPAVTLGEALKTRIGFISPQNSFNYTENNLIAGQYRAIAIDMQGISPQQLESLQAELESTQADLEADNTASLTKHDIVGGIMQAGVQGYMAMTYASDRIAAQAAGVAFYRQPSYGTFGTHMEVSYLITGVPTQVHFTGVVMDIDRLSVNVEEKANCYEGWVAFNRASGMRNSAYEHSIPEQLFSTDTEQAEGVSTAKALAIAMASGQRIYTLTGENAAQLNNITIDDGARAEIQQALIQGFEVTVHQSPVSVNSWTGSGYTIIDADYGIGAYKISGGSSGAFIQAIAAFIDGLSWVALAVGLQGTLHSLLGSVYGGPVAVLAGYANLLTTIWAWSLVCGDLAANLLFTFMAIGMASLGLLLSTAVFGFIGLMFAVIISVAMQFIAAHLSAVVANDCRTD